jgi:hypothetical protein
MAVRDGQFRPLTDGCGRRAGRVRPAARARAGELGADSVGRRRPWWLPA